MIEELKKSKFIIIGKFDMLPFIIVSINLVTVILENVG
jgi:hypothetical protein